MRVLFVKWRLSSPKHALYNLNTKTFLPLTDMGAKKTIGFVHMQRLFAKAKVCGSSDNRNTVHSFRGHQKIGYGGLQACAMRWANYIWWKKQATNMKSVCAWKAHISLHIRWVKSSLLGKTPIFNKHNFKKQCAVQILEIFSDLSLRFSKNEAISLQIFATFETYLEKFESTMPKIGWSL